MTHGALILLIVPFAIEQVLFLSIKILANFFISVDRFCLCLREADMVQSYEWQSWLCVVAHWFGWSALSVSWTMRTTVGGMCTILWSMQICDCSEKIFWKRVVLCCCFVYMQLPSLRLRYHCDRQHRLYRMQQTPPLLLATIPSQVGCLSVCLQTTQTLHNATNNTVATGNISNTGRQFVFLQSVWLLAHDASGCKWPLFSGRVSVSNFVLFVWLSLSVSLSMYNYFPVLSCCTACWSN